MTDILELISTSQINEYEAGIIFNNTVEEFHAGKIKSIPEELNLNNYEWTAVCQGISWQQLALWRLVGWPESCSICGRKINYLDYGWMIDLNGLHHINCSRRIL